MTLLPPPPPATPAPSTRQAPVRGIVLALVGVLLLGVGFVGGIAFQSTRDVGDLAGAVEDLAKAAEESNEYMIDGSAFDSEMFFEEDGFFEEGDYPDPVELKPGESVETESVYSYATVRITLVDVTVGPASGEYGDQPELTRSVRWTVRIENTGDEVAEPFLFPQVESADGRVSSDSQATCSPGLPGTPLRPGQYAEGCTLSDVTADAARLVFTDVEEPFFIAIPAA